MEDLQYVIQDIKYVGALKQGDAPQPTQFVPKPPETFERAAYAQANGLTFATILRDPIGLWTLESYLPDDTKWVCAFLEAVLNFKLVPSMQTAKGILEEYPQLRALDGGARFEESRAAVDGELPGFPAGVLDPLVAAVTADISTAHADEHAASEHFARYVGLHWASTQDIQIRDFTLMRDLGRGAFGLVRFMEAQVAGVVCSLTALFARTMSAGGSGGGGGDDGDASHLYVCSFM